jgi:hypothetical protein
MYGIAKEVFSVILTIPKNVISENLIHEIPNHNKHRIEYIVIREWFVIAMGRMPSYLLLLFVGSLSSFSLRMVILLMSLVIVVEILLVRSIKLYSNSSK